MAVKGRKRTLPLLLMPSSARQIDRVRRRAVTVVFQLADVGEAGGAGHVLLAAGAGEHDRAAGLQRRECP